MKQSKISLIVVAFGVIVTFADPAIADYPSLVNSLNPIAYWRFNDASSAEGDTAADSSAGGTHSGTYHNGVTLITSDLPGPGSGGKAASFDGTDYVGNISETGFPAGNAARTFVTWLKYTPPTIYIAETIFRYGTDTSTNHFGVAIYNRNYSQPPINGAVGVSQWGISTGFDPTVDGNWHFYAITVEDSNYRLYFDGEFVREQTMTTNTLLGSGACISRPEQLDAYVDEMALFGTVLTDQNILDLYNTMPEPATLGLLLIGGMVLIRRRKVIAVDQKLSEL